MSSLDPGAAWPRRALGTVAERIFLGLADARQRGGGEAREMPLLNVRDLHNGQIAAAETLANRTLPVGADVERYRVRADDVVVTCRGTQLKVASITPSCEGALISANLIAIRTGEDLLPAVLFAFLQSPAGQRALLQRGRSFTSSMSLTTKAVGELLIPVPPLAVQKEIAELISSAEQNYAAGIRAAEQRRAVANAVAVDLLWGKTGI